MKSKKLLFSGLFMLGGIVLAMSLMSSNSGQMGAYSSGCGNCHGASSAGTTSATTITFTGIPTAGYTTGTSYPVTVTITNSDSTLTHGGFDLNFAAGTISGAPANTMVMGTELHHTAKKIKTGNSVSWSFNWTAPSAASVILNIAGNFVNGDTTSTGDKWSTTVITLTKATPTNVTSVNTNGINVYPNPSTHVMNVQTESPIVGIQTLNTFGQLMSAEVINAKGYSAQINTSNLANGNYILRIQTENGVKYTQFNKQ